MRTSKNKYLAGYEVFRALLVVCVFGLMTGGGDVMAEKNTNVDLEQVSSDKWKELENKRIFFAHHSVGNDIFDGIETIKSQNSAVNINVVELNEPTDLVKDGKGSFFHGEAGKNFDPRSKVADFVKWNEESIGGNVDVAFMKFCFVDINTRTDVPALFKDYRDNLLILKNKYPETKFVHVTVPLVSEKTGLAKWKHKLKGVVKNILGKDEFYENENKFIFNEMIRKEYIGKESIFDLAAIESTFPDGQRSTFLVSGEEIESMVPAYTYDGGHLTPLGKKVVAEKLLLFLTDMD